MKNGKYIQYSRIFHTLPGNKISCCQLLPLYSELPQIIAADFSYFEFASVQFPGRYAPRRKFGDSMEYAQSFAQP